MGVLLGSTWSTLLSGDIQSLVHKVSKMLSSNLNTDVNINLLVLMMFWGRQSYCWNLINQGWNASRSSAYETLSLRGRMRWQLRRSSALINEQIFIINHAAKYIKEST